MIEKTAMKIGTKASSEANTKLSTSRAPTPPSIASRSTPGPSLPPAILLRGILFWSRLHGLISLELDRHISSMQLDPDLLYRAELAELGAET